MKVELTEIEQEFRNSWRDFDPQRYASFLDQTSAETRLELLARLLGAELEFAFQPPTIAMAPSQRDSDDDERVKPCVQLFLLRFPELAQASDLLIRLVVLEYALRLRHDEVPPDPESYLSLFHESQDRLAKLLELTERKLPARHREQAKQPVSHSDSTVNESQVSVSITLDPLPLNLGCFLLIRLIGKGGMGYVHAAIDLRSTAQVAVKVMRRIDSWSVYRFIEEFSWLSRLDHPHLVKLYDAFCDGRIRYFSMELVEGKTIREWFQRFPPTLERRWDELRRVLRQLASAVQYLHNHGVLHCDIKCSNIMITPSRRAVLLDLGLAVREEQENRLVGTMQYMAPEILAGKSATQCSDWYSFGAMIHEVICGHFPPLDREPSPDHESLGDPRSNQHDPAFQMNLQQLERYLQDCPRDLAELCMALLQVEPARRPSGAEVVARLGGRRESKHQFHAHLECAGREAELGEIDAAVRRSQATDARLIIVNGESGIGKSTLLSHWMKHAKPADCLLLSVRCYRQDHTPVRMLNALVQELVLATANLPAEKWQPTLEDNIKEISVVFPQVQQLVESDLPRRPGSLHAAPPDTPRATSIQALLRWLQLFSRQQRLVICIDDAHWADDESLQALQQLLSHADGFHGTAILTDESDDCRTAAKLRAPTMDHSDATRTFQTKKIVLGPLVESTRELLLESWARQADVDLDPSITKHISVHSGGNPFLLLELFRTYVHHVQREGTVGTDWLTIDSQSNVRRRFSMLPRQAEDLLQYLSVADQPVGFHQLQMVSRILPHELQRTLSFLASQGWVRSQSEDLESDVEIAHENFRRVVLQSMPKERLCRRHFRMARILSSETPPPWARIADHYWLAEHYREAATCYLEAARIAISSSAFQAAVYFLDLASHPAAERTPYEQTRVAWMKADCLSRIGSSRAAAELYDQVLPEVEDPKEALIVKCLAGEQWIRAGQLDLGLSRLKDVLGELKVASSKRNFLSRLGMQVRTLRMAFTNPHLATEHRQPNRVDSGLSEMEQCLNRIIAPLTFLDNQLGPDLILRLTKLADERGSDFDRSLALTRSGILLSFAGGRWRKRGFRRLRRGRRLARACNSDEARATGNFCMFVWNIQCGKLMKALRHCQSAIRQFDAGSKSTRWEKQFLHWASLGCYWSSNQLRLLQQSTQDLRTSARHRSDPMSLYLMQVGAAHRSDLVSDKADQARRSLKIARDAIASQSFQSPRFFLWLSKVHQALYENQPREALQLLTADWRQLDKSFVLRSNHYRWLALGTRICCDLCAYRDRLPKHGEHLRDARRSVRHMLRLQEPVFVEYGHAFGLAIEAVAGNVQPMAEWDSTIQRLHQLDHHLMAYALQWNQSCFAPSADRPRLRSTAESALRDEGCVAPERLLNLILPLPYPTSAGE